MRNGDVLQCSAAFAIIENREGTEMDINALSKRFRVLRLGEEDVERIYELSCGNRFFISITRRLSRGKAYGKI